jgi:rfaE bifunctional protein kinase chain/domain
MLLPPLAPERANRIVEGFLGARVLVVGDVMLDTFVIGHVTRVSPEAPVPVVAFEREMSRIGGAANVAHNVAALGGGAALIAVVGRDEAAAALMQGCREAGLDPAFIEDGGRRTTRKVRLVTGRNQQVARIDYEDDVEVTGETERRIADAVTARAANAQAIVISDYLKGGVSATVVRAAIEAAASTGAPVLVDPKIPHLAFYAGATVVTPNHHEAEAATHARVRCDADARAVAQMFRDRAGCRAVLMTRGDQGMWLLGADDCEGSLPAVAREVADVTGAGDTVVAVLALALAAGATLAEAACVANEAAGISVGKFGPATVSQTELRRALRIADPGNGELSGG